MRRFPERVRLSTARDARRELSRVYRLVMQEQVSPDLARAAVAALRAVVETIRVDEFDQRLRALEAKP